MCPNCFDGGPPEECYTLQPGCFIPCPFPTKDPECPKD